MKNMKPDGIGMGLSLSITFVVIVGLFGFLGFQFGIVGLVVGLVIGFGAAVLSVVKMAKRFESKQKNDDEDDHNSGNGTS